MRTWLSLEVTGTPKAGQTTRRHQHQHQHQHQHHPQKRRLGETGKRPNQKGKGKRDGNGQPQNGSGGKSAAAARGEAGTGTGAEGLGNRGHSIASENASKKAGRGAAAGGSLTRIGSGDEENQQELEMEMDWFVQARLEGTLIGAPEDGVERRFTSFFSRVALELDSKAFPDVAAVEVSYIHLSPCSVNVEGRWEMTTLYSFILVVPTCPFEVDAMCAQHGRTDSPSYIPPLPPLPSLPAVAVNCTYLRFLFVGCSYSSTKFRCAIRGFSTLFLVFQFSFVIFLLSQS